jgi:hypothetical protein
MVRSVRSKRKQKLKSGVLPDIRYRGFFGLVAFPRLVAKSGQFAGNRLKTTRSVNVVHFDWNNMTVIPKSEFSLTPAVP